MITKHLLKIFLKERCKIPYIVSQIINIFLENDFTFRVPQIVTHGLVLFLSFKMITSFLVRSPFLELELFHPAWNDLNHKGVPCLLKGRSITEHTQTYYFLLEDIPLSKVAIYIFFSKTNDFYLLLENKFD